MIFMRKLIVTITAPIAFFVLNAQTTFGIHGDVIFSKQKIKANGITITGDDRTSWKAGLISNIPLASQFAFMPQLNLLSKGTKLSFQGVSGESKLTYLELPLNFAYTSNGFFIGLGPVLSYGLSGKEESGGTSTDVKFDGEANPTDDLSHYKAFEFGGDIIAGYKLANGIFFNAHYNMGFSNIYPTSDGDVKNQYFGFGIGYFFNAASSVK
jgi:hypothetical protein